MGLFDLFSSKNEQEAARMKAEGLNKGYDLASGLYGEGRDAITNYGAQALAPFQTLFGQGQQGSSAYGDAVGLNGAGGIQRATDTFRSLPGYASGLETGLDALDRRAASRGMLASGNNTQDTLKFAGDYNDQKYGNYLSSLMPYFGQQQGAAQGIAGVNTGMGSALNQSFTNQGQLGWQKESGIGDANAAAELSKDQSGANLLNAAFGAANLAGKFMGVGGFAPSFGGQSQAMWGPSPNGPGTYAPIYR